MLSRFVTWGDLKETHRHFYGSGYIVSIDRLADRNTLKTGYCKQDDEFYFDLDPGSITEARLERWPRSPQPEDHEDYFVTTDNSGSVLLVLLLVNDERFYYRKNLEWVYIGPGDNIFGFDEDPLVPVAPQITEFFDYAESNDFILVEESITCFRI